MIAAVIAVCVIAGAVVGCSLSEKEPDAIASGDETQNSRRNGICLFKSRNEADSARQL